MVGDGKDRRTVSLFVLQDLRTNLLQMLQHNLNHLQDFHSADVLSLRSVLSIPVTL